MKSYVLGTGPSVLYFGNKIRKEIVVGVNYVWQYYPADIVISCDKPMRLPDWKLQIICNGLQRQFISPYQEWQDIVHNFIHKPFTGCGRGNLKDLDDITVLSYAANGGYAAIVQAYHLGAKEIICYGIDFTNHPAIDGKMAEKEIQRILMLRDVLKQRGVEMFVGNKETKLFPAIKLFKDN